MTAAASHTSDGQSVFVDVSVTFDLCVSMSVTVLSCLLIGCDGSLFLNVPTRLCLINSQSAGGLHRI